MNIRISVIYFLKYLKGFEYYLNYNILIFLLTIKRFLKGSRPNFILKCFKFVNIFR